MFTVEKVVEAADALILLNKFAGVSTGAVLRVMLLSLILRGIITENLQLALDNQDSWYLKDGLL